MKKRGFTLAEILITLGIIAVASAILAPAIMNMRPDRYKFKVLDCYRLANEATEAMLSNPEIYYRKAIDANASFLSNGMLNPVTQYGCNGLKCTLKPTLSQFNNTKYSGNCKYPNLMTAFLKLDNVTDCNNNASPYVATGTMNNIIEWQIQYIPTVGVYTIMIDMNSTEGPNASYSSSQTHPDRFTFWVKPSGDILGSDNLTRVYLSNMANTDKSADFEEAAEQ